MFTAKRASMALLVAVSGAVHAEPQTYAVDPQHTFPVFEVSHYGYSLQRGRFNNVSGSVVLDRVARGGSIDIAIDAASLDMGLPDWDEKMRSTEFFDTARHPQITFKADTLRFKGDRLVGADGTLTLLGVSQPVSIAIENFQCGRNKFSGKRMCGADATAKIQRSAFGMRRLLPGIGDDIRILISIEAVAAGVQTE